MIINDLTSQFKPSVLTAYERFEALIPILSEASETYFRLYSEKKSAKRDAEVNARLTGLFTKVAKNSSMAVEEVRRAFQSYMVKGMSGLTTPGPLSARECVQHARGTWELVSRLTNGGQTPHARPDNLRTRARSNIYYEVKSDTELKELCTMWNDENHYPRDEELARRQLGAKDTFFIVSYVESKFTQLDDFTVEYTCTGEVCGNHGNYQTPAKGASRVLLMRLDGEPSFMSVPETYAVMANGKKVPATGTFLLLNYPGGPKARGFSMSGLPPMFGDNRSMDVSDQYVKISDQQPLVGGWEPIDAYYERLRNLPVHAEKMKRRSAGRRTVHGFYSEDRDTLKRYDIVA